MLGISRAHIAELLFDLLFIVRDNKYVLPVLFLRSVDMNFVPGPWPKMQVSSCSFRKRDVWLLCVLGISRAHIMKLMFDLLLISEYKKYMLPILF